MPLSLISRRIEASAAQAMVDEVAVNSAIPVFEWMDEHKPEREHCSANDRIEVFGVSAYSIWSAARANCSSRSCLPCSTP